MLLVLCVVVGVVVVGVEVIVVGVKVIVVGVVVFVGFVFVVGVVVFFGFVFVVGVVVLVFCNKFILLTSSPPSVVGWRVLHRCAGHALVFVAGRYQHLLSLPHSLSENLTTGSSGLPSTLSSAHLLFSILFNLFI